MTAVINPSTGAVERNAHSIAWSNTPSTNAATAAIGIEVIDAITAAARIRTVTPTSSDAGVAIGADIAARIAAIPLNKPAATHTRCVVPSTLMPSVAARSRFSADARIAMPAEVLRKYASSAPITEQVIATVRMSGARKIAGFQCSDIDSGGGAAGPCGNWLNRRWSAVASRRGSSD